MKPQATAESVTKTTAMSGIGVSIKMIKKEETTPSSKRVTRSPRQAAIGGAILSGCSLI